MRVIFAEGHGASEKRELVGALGATDARLLWALRRLAIMQPIGAARCHAVHIALHQDFGEAGMGVEHVLRCIVVGLARTATRQLVIGEPGCAIVMADEATLLALMEGTTGHAALIAMAGTKDAVRLMPLFQAVSALLRS